MREERGPAEGTGLLSIDQATALVQQTLDRLRLSPKRSAQVPLAESLGLVLADSVVGDVDCPPFDKSLVDGYAVSLADVAVRPISLEVGEEVMAGSVPTQQVGGGRVVRIMTGAPLPAGTEAVIMVEETRRLPTPSTRVQVESRNVVRGQNILRKARCYAAGQTLIEAGKQLRPADIGLMAEAGYSRVAVHPRPRVAILSTGNELVSVDAQPGPGQIRNSNGAMLEALVVSAGGLPLSLGVARDEPEALEAAIRQGLSADVLLLSGGVSAGVLDLVPQVLKKLDVQQVFHKISLKPGKPLWFGAQSTSDRASLVFGLPGNPVSSLVCFELFVRPAIARMMGLRGEIVRRHAVLSEAFQHRGDRPTLFPGICDTSADGPAVRLLRWQGSADLRTCAEANCLVWFATGDADYPAGASVTVIMLGTVSG